jgi:glycosyltransferase involved in cell wall biosynthesis
MYECFDDNFFATRFHIDLFTQTFFEDDRDIDRQLLHSIRQVGWPMEYIESDLADYKGMAKEDTILFPHRLAPEKQPEVFDYLAEQMPEYNWVKCQELNLSKEEYHTMLGKAKMVFSANLQETLGISVFEGLVVGAIPLVPDRLSYTEMWSDTFKYPSEWTTSLDAVKENIEQIKTHIRILMNKNSDMEDAMSKEIENVRNFYSVDNLVKELHKYR